MDSKTKGLYAEFNHVIETKLNRAIEYYMNNEDDSALLDKISLYSSILNSMSSIDKNTQMVEVEKQLEESMKNFDPSVLEGFLANFGNFNK